MNVTDQQLDNLFKSCDPATFGRAQQDVLDESYRKAGKLDANRFATHFSPTDVGILETVSDLLLRDRVPEKSIHLELYKLNVYGCVPVFDRMAVILMKSTGPGGFFKGHVDTPRSDTMFASLVIVLPTVHEGGSLVIRHNGKEWTFDSSKAVNAESTPHAAFVAFFSDVEHEVLPVSSGYRVTLTYNLYLKKKNAAKRTAAIATFTQTDEGIKNALEGVCAFLPEGGILGFGLGHRYPFSQVSTRLSNIAGCLKGTDAAIKRACDSLSIPITIKAVYRDEYGAILLDHFADFGYRQIDDSLLAYLKENENGLVIYNFGGRPPEEFRDNDNDTYPIIWVKPLAKTNPFSSSYISYGNEATLSYVYGEICLVATVPPADKRVDQ